MVGTSAGRGLKRPVCEKSFKHVGAVDPYSNFWVAREDMIELKEMVKGGKLIMVSKS